LHRFIKIALPALAGAALFATSASANVIDLDQSGWPTRAEAAVAEQRKALLMEAALSAPLIGVPPIPMPAPVEVTDADLKHVPKSLVGAMLAAAKKYDLSPLLIDAVARQESGYRTNAVSRVGALGVMQLMPATARMLGVRNPLDPHANIEGGARYLRGLLDRFDGNLAFALAAYNAGPARVERARGIPRIAETQNYVTKILARLSKTAVAPAGLMQIATSQGE
jgi:soluble lytic murein transglycosylase-like protein